MPRQFFYQAQQGLKLGVVLLGLLLAVPTTAMAEDVAHFQDGKVLRGKLFRVTGDIIEFKVGGWRGGQKNIHRIQLNNRNDIIKMRSSENYFGEIIYIDKFTIDLKTSTGNIKLNRFHVDEVVLGSPSQPTQLIEPTMVKAPSAEIPVSHQPQQRVEPVPAVNSDSEKPRVYFPNSMPSAPITPPAGLESEQAGHSH